MNIQDKYAEILLNMEDIVQKRTRENRYPALGLTSNLDLLCDFNADILNELLMKYLPEGSLETMKPVKVIRSIGDLLETMVYYCRNGIGGEADIEDVTIIKECFPCRYGMGGTAAQAALALQNIECPSIVHLTDDSKEVCELLDFPEIYFVAEGGTLTSTGKIKQSQEQEVHGIVQFRKGDKIRLRNQEITIPLSNRLILTKTTVNEYLPLSEPYFQYIQQHADQISSCVLSGFNCIQDRELLKKRLEYIKNQAIAYHEANEKGIMFFEDSHYHDREIRNISMNALYPYVDIVSLNEEELSYTLEEFGVPIDYNEVGTYVNGLRWLRQHFNVKRGVIVHTKDFSMYVGDPLEQDIEEGLIYGNLLATAKAMNGWYGSLEQIRELMKNPLSEKGKMFREYVKKEMRDESVIVVPTRYADRPPYTIGLGDSFVAGVQICF